MSEETIEVVVKTINNSQNVFRTRCDPQCSPSIGMVEFRTTDDTVLTFMMDNIEYIQRYSVEDESEAV